MTYLIYPQFDDSSTGKNGESCTHREQTFFPEHLNLDANANANANANTNTNVALNRELMVMWTLDAECECESDVASGHMRFNP